MNNIYQSFYPWRNKTLAHIDKTDGWMGVHQTKYFGNRKISCLARVI